MHYVLFKRTVFSFAFTFIFAITLSANLLDDKLIYAALVAVVLNLASLLFYLPWSLRRIGYHGFNLIAEDILKITLRATSIVISLSLVLFFIPSFSYVADLFIFIFVGWRISF